MIEQTISVLLVEDNPGDARLIREELKDCSFTLFHCRVAETLEAGLAAFEEGAADVVLLDLSLPDSRGLDTVRSMVAQAPEVPIVVLTGTDDKETALEAIRGGARNYLVKGKFGGEVLERTILFAVEQHRSAASLEAERRRLRASRRFLEVTNRYSEMGPLLEALIDEVQMYNGCRAVGIRILDEQGNIPYEAYKGFSKEFYELESPLSVKSDHCMCINVFNRSTDARLAWFTEGGSFHTNCLTELLASVSEEEKGSTRNICNKFGYESVALVPIILGDKVMGVIHVADERKDMVPLDMVETLESAGLTLGSALQRVSSQQELGLSFEKLTRSMNGTISAVGRMLELRDPYTAGHQARVARIAVAIGAELGLDGDRLEGVRVASAMHDLGKIYVPAEILSKPGRITDIEFGIIKAHSRYGYDILKPVEFPWPVADIVLQHHERMDGSGYPNGLKGEAILLESRIIGVADVVEAMTSHRPYRPALGRDIALEEISKGRGSRYDADVADACVKICKNRRFETGEY